jgi:hypothetical protein
MGVIAHATCDQDHRADALERPPLCLKARVQGSLLEDRQYTRPRRWAQAGGPAGKGTGAPARHIALMLVELLSPCADSHPTNAQSAGHVGVGEWSGLEPPAGFQTSCFTLTTGEVLWAPHHGRLL